jgi:hypothetical protein
MTYYLVQAGIMMFVVRPEMGSGLVHACIAGTTAALMTGYCLYLGRRKFFESQVQQGIPDNLRSCPFVMGILSKAGVASNGPSLTTTSSGREQTEKVG